MKAPLGCGLSIPFSPQAGIDGEKEHANAKKILMEMGEFFQIQVGRREAPAANRLRLFFLSRRLFIPPLSSPHPPQDDYLDLFGDPSVTGKIGTDIQDNKCSWLVVQCLQRASPEQRQILQVPQSGLWIPELPKRGIELVVLQ